MGLYASVRKNVLSYHGNDAEKAGLAMLHPAATLVSAPLVADIARYFLSPSKNVRRTFSEVFPGYVGPSFSNQLSVPAGFDKNCDYIMLAYALGFGYHVVGSISENPREGNPHSPRIVSLDDFGAAWNRMGLNNIGAKEARKKINTIPKYARNNFPIFASVVQDPDAQSLEEAVRSTRAAIGILYACVDGLEIDISCPNMYAAETFQNPENLEKLLGSIPIEQASAYSVKQSDNYRRKPVLLKCSVNLDESEYRSIIEIGNHFGVAGYVIGNTLPAQEWIDSLSGEDRKHVSMSLTNAGAYNSMSGKFEGGISGRPLEAYVDHVVEIIQPFLEGKALVIVGGTNQNNIARRLQKANLVQSYTYFVQQGGPGFVKQMLHSSL